MTNPIIRNVARRATVQAAERTVTFVMSNAIVDRAGDTVDPNGWHLENFRKNPVLLWSHDHGLPAIGRVLSPRVEGSNLIGDCQFATAEQHAFADTIFRLVEADIISTGSVGFIPLRWEYRDEPGAYGVDFKEQELLEYSVTNVPMNATCLARAVASGINLEPLATAVGAKNLQTAEPYADLRAKLLALNPPASNAKSPSASLNLARAKAANNALRVRL